MEDAGQAMLFLLLVVLVIAGVIFGPLLIIWSLNTLFHLEIAYTLSTWFATLTLSGVFASTSRK